MRELRGVRVVLAAAAAMGGGIVAGAGPASSQEPPGDPAVTADVVADAIAEDGWYADADAVGDREQLADVADRLASGRDPMGFVLLAREPEPSSTAFADDVLDALPMRGAGAIDTVVVLSDADVAVASDTWSDQAIDGALDETIDDLRADRTDGLEALADALAAQPTGFDDSSGSDDGDSDGSKTGLIVGGVVVLVALSIGSRYLSGSSDGGYDDGSYDDGNSSWRRRRRSFHRSSSFSSRRRSSSGRSSRRSSGGSRRGHGSRRL